MAQRLNLAAALGLQRLPLCLMLAAAVHGVVHLQNIFQRRQMRPDAIFFPVSGLVASSGA